MQFKIKSTIYKISFSFFALVLLILTTTKSNEIILTIFFALLHEIVHLISINLFSVAPDKVTLTIFGANIQRGTASTNSIASEIIINASAPVFNILTGAVFFIFSDHSLHYTMIFSEICNINLMLGCFNLIPFYSFDGGNILKNLLRLYFTKRIIDCILTCVSIIITIIFSFISVYIFLNYQHNYSLFVMCFYMLLSIIFKKQKSLDY